MKLIELIRAADKGYQKAMANLGPSLLDYVDEDGQPIANPPTGDTLARFIVNELCETYEPDAPNEDQITEAVRVMKDARRDLDYTIDALEDLED